MGQKQSIYTKPLIISREQLQKDLEYAKDLKTKMWDHHIKLTIDIIKSDDIKKYEESVKKYWKNNQIIIEHIEYLTNQLELLTD